MAQYLLIVLIIVIDQFSKYMIVQSIPFAGTIEIIPFFFDLTYYQNPGAAWGFLAEHNWGIVVLRWFSVLLTIALLIVLRNAKMKITKIPLILIIGGSIGNLIDRFRLSYVVDFLRFFFGPYEFPAFNVADSCIVVGAFLLIIFILKYPDCANDLKLRKSKNVVRGGEDE